MGKSKARSAAALRAHGAVARAEAPPTDAPTAEEPKEPPAGAESRMLRGKIEFVRSATRSALGLSKVYLNAADMSSYGLEAGAYVAVMDASDDYGGRLLLSGVAWPLDKIKRHGIGLSAMWEDHIRAALTTTTPHGVVRMLQDPASSVRRLEAQSLILGLVSRGAATSAGSAGDWPPEAARPVLAQYVQAMLEGVLVHPDARLSLSVHGAPTVLRVVAVKGSGDDPAANDSGRRNIVYRISRATSMTVHWSPVDATPTDADPTHSDDDSSNSELRNKTQEDDDRTRRQELSAAGLASIGGLAAEIATIREILEPPLVNPGLFATYGLPPPKGLLLFGPPGTGKTMLARALARDLGARVFFINGPEVVSKFIGESEANLRRIFTAAARAGPSLIFIDEIDAICPKRDGRVGEMDKRMVATLLTLMDGLERQAQVVVLAATNRPNALDPAIRRPGRFDREVEIPIPNAVAREAILRVTLAPLPHAVTDDELRDLAASAHGYVGADLSALCKEAALVALRRASSQASPSSFCLTRGDLAVAARGIRPSALREIAIDVPRVYWADIGGQAALKQQLREAVEWPLRHPEAFVRMGIRPPKGVLLYGPPGCSKTLTAKALATESAMNFMAIKGPELFSKWVGESEKAVQTIFRKARAAAPTVVFFDEIDALATQRGGGGSSQVADRVLSQLLTELDGIEPLKQVLVVAATNRPDLLDSALMRPGRIDRVLYVGPPDAPARREILGIHCRRMPLAPDVDLDELAEWTDGYSGAELASVCREAAMHAIAADRHARVVARAHFAQARERITPQIDAAMLAFFEGFRDGRSRR